MPLRLLLGPDNRLVVPGSALMGALFLLACDTAARSLTSAEIPVGIITALAGGPFLAYLVRQRTARPVRVSVMLVVRDLHFSYGPLPVLHGVVVRCEGRRRVRAVRAERLRQDHPVPVLSGPAPGPRLHPRRSDGHVRRPDCRRPAGAAHGLRAAGAQAAISAACAGRRHARPHALPRTARARVGCGPGRIVADTIAWIGLTDLADASLRPPVWRPATTRLDRPCRRSAHAGDPARRTSLRTRLPQSDAHLARAARRWRPREPRCSVAATTRITWCGSAIASSSCRRGASWPRASGRRIGRLDARAALPRPL